MRRCGVTCGVTEHVEGEAVEDGVGCASSFALGAYRRGDGLRQACSETVTGPLASLMALACLDPAVPPSGWDTVTAALLSCAPTATCTTANDGLRRSGWRRCWTEQEHRKWTGEGHGGRHAAFLHMGAPGIEPGTSRV
jgi:hypothetical protein